MTYKFVICADVLRSAIFSLAVTATIATSTAFAVPQASDMPVGKTAVAQAIAKAQSADNPGDAGSLLTNKIMTNLDPALAAVAVGAQHITYRSYSLDARAIVVSGAVIIPKGTAPQGGWPVVSWGHGSSGTNDQCAPSTVLDKDGNIDFYGYAGFIAQLVRAGYAVVATDYEGLGTPGEHPYIVADSEGRGMIDAVRAGLQAAPGLSRSWFAVGHSQGGQAAIAAGELADHWGKGLNFRGTVGIAPVTNVGQAYNYGSPGTVDRGFYLLALRGIKTQHPELRYEDYLGSQALAMLPVTENECTMKIWQTFSANLGEAVNDYQFAPQNPDAALALQPLLDAQSVPRGRTPGPMLLLQGDRDPSIKTAVTLQAVRNAVAAGTDAEFRVYPGQDHYSILAPGVNGGAASDIINWLNSHKDQ